MVQRPPRGVRRIRLSRMRESSTRSQVYAQMRAEITSLSMRPGQLLSESELADLYGVSRTPVREALIRLADENLVEVVPQLGTYVSRINVRDVTEAQFIRETLERASLPQAIKKMTPEGENRLRALVAQQQAAGTRGDLAEWFSTDEQLHRTLLEIAGHPKTWWVVSSIKAHLDRVRMLSLPDPEILSSMHGQHATLVDHVVAKRTQQADRLLTRHLRGVLGVLGPLEKQHPDYFVVDDEDDAPASRGAARAR